MLLGAIADDLTGATDLANTLVGEGMRVVQIIGVPDPDLTVPDVDAIVIALKSRSIPADEAVALSLQSLQWLKKIGTQQFFFKYCSTFDSTDKGNIGPVAEALMADLGEDLSIFCPAFPKNGRTIFQGHLFVGDRLLSDSGMQNHPLNPMTDADLVRVLGRQVKGKAALVPYAVVRQGADAIRSALEKHRQAGVNHVVVDAISDEDLFAIGGAVRDLKLITGGSGVALGLPENFRRQGSLAQAGKAGQGFPKVTGPAVVLAGSCSRATLGQIAYFKERRPTFHLDVAKLAEGDDQAGAAMRWAQEHLGDEPILIYASGSPEEVQAIQQKYGREAAGEMAEKAMGAVASALLHMGARRFVVAGGETSGAVMQALGVQALQIGPEIDPGVPWTFSTEGDPLALALKSGNFGTEDFLLKAFGKLP